MIKHSPGARESLENVKLARASLLSASHPQILQLGGGEGGPLPLEFGKRVRESC